MTVFIDYAKYKQPDLIQLFLDSGFDKDIITSDSAKEFVEAVSSGAIKPVEKSKALDWERLEALSTGKRGKF